MWFYVNHVLVPYQRVDAAAHRRPRGNLSDLYPRWLGARELLLRHRDPYSDEITREIQVGYYGRELDPARAEDPKDRQAFAYPAYVVFLLAPTVAAPFDTVKIAFQWLLVVVTAASVWLWLQAIRWPPGSARFVTLVLLTVGSFPAVQGFKLQQLSLLVAFLIALSAALLVGKRLFASGSVLALATIKPQLAVPLAGCLLLWAASHWGERRKFIWGFAGTITTLVGGAELLLPGWIGRFQVAVRDYEHYTGGLSMLDILLSPAWGKRAGVAVVLGVAAVCWRWRRENAAGAAFPLMVALVLLGTVMVIPSFAPYNQVLLLPPILLLLRGGRRLWAGGRWSGAALALAGGTILWPWLAALGLCAASLAVGPASVLRAWWLPLYPFVHLPLPLVCLAPLAFLVVEAWRQSAQASEDSRESMAPAG
jgi:hypothetical protein